MTIEERMNQIIANKQEKMLEVAEDILRDTKQQAETFKRSGNLANSHEITIVSEDEIIVGVNKEKAPYAMEVHENPDSLGYKWFERTIIQNKQNYLNKIRGE